MSQEAVSITVVIHLLLSSLYVATVNEGVWVSGRTEDGRWSNLVVDNRAQTKCHTPRCPVAWGHSALELNLLQRQLFNWCPAAKKPQSCRIIVFIHYIPVNTHVSLYHVSCLQVYNLLKYVFPRCQSAVCFLSWDSASGSLLFFFFLAPWLLCRNSLKHNLARLSVQSLWCQPALMLNLPESDV